MACSYLASGWAIRRTSELNALTLLTNAFIWMGLFSALGLAVTWRAELFGAGFWHRLVPVFGALFFYSLAQMMMFAAQRKVDASLLVPLLGLKLPMLMLLNLVLFHAHFTWLQVLAVVLTVLAAFLLNRTSREVTLGALGLVLSACLLFSLSDTCLQIEVDLLQSELGFSPALAAALCAFLIYLLAGLIGVAVLACNRPLRTRRALLHSLPYGVFWIISIVFLNLCFAILGTVNGNILQSTRGIFAIFLAPVLAACGLTYLEHQVSWGIIVRRLVAASLMVAAIILYNFHC
ncbi:MAG: hypothetical protein J5654_11175 [Victivallales bacterium]|nr:hypothetical protein [Victivallales bacterium]